MCTVLLCWILIFCCERLDYGSESTVLQFEQASSSSITSNKIKTGNINIRMQRMNSETRKMQQYYIWATQSAYPTGVPAHLQLAEIFWIKFVFAALWVMCMVAHISCLNVFVCVWMTGDYLPPTYATLHTQANVCHSFHLPSVVCVQYHITVTFNLCIDIKKI